MKEHIRTCLYAPLLALGQPVLASDYQWTKVLQAPIDESYFGTNDPRNRYDPLFEGHPVEGSVARRNGGYAWGVTSYHDEIWYGAFMNGWCLWLQPAGLPMPTPENRELYNYTSEKNACNLDEPSRPPVIQVFNTKSNKLEVYQSDDPRFAEDMHNIVAIRAASTVNDIVFITALLGPEAGLASGDMKSDESYFFKGIRIFGINAATKQYLGSVTMKDLNEARKMSVITHPDGSKGLYIGVSSRSGKSYLMRWTGNAKNPFPAGTRNAEYRGFEKVIDNSGHGLIGEVQSLKTPDGETRLVVSTWSSWPSVNRAGGVYITEPIPAHGLHAGRAAGTLHPLLTLDQFDPDPIIGPTWGGGMLSIYNGEIYWGTMTIGTAYTGAFTAANPSVGDSPTSRNDIARAMFSRAAHLFKINVTNLAHPKIELLFGNEYFPTLNKENGTWSLKRNLLNLTPKLGKAGFGYGTNNYSWESAVHNGKLFIGTMDYSGGLADYVENAPPHADQQIDANYRVAKEQGFMPGGDLLVFEQPNEQPIIITRSGLDNIDNNGFRNFVTVNNILYVGTSSEANLGPHAGYSFYVLNN